ncbi:Fanconi anemia group E protein isoform X2 [Engystomops pustulosus]|uniref:Fanconi anemia group E protein isoform X2 n=1 Tax=Engystomops pustulosus TaxID=76066 RepID=UPI003AFA8D0F
MASFPVHNDRVGHLFLQALGAGSNGVLAAYRLIQTYPGPFPWNRLLENLCMKVPSQDVLTGKLILKPKLFQLPIQLQRNLFSFLNCVCHILPTPCIQLLIETVRIECCISDDWLLYLTDQFLKNSDHETHVQRTQVMQRLQNLFQGWNETGAEQSKLGQYKKHWPSSLKDCGMHSERETPLENETGSTYEVCTIPQSIDSVEELKSDEASAPKEAEDVPVFIKGHILILRKKMHLEMDSEALDQEYLLNLQYLCSACNPLQLQTVFSSIGVLQISPKCLFQLCTHLDSISPDLSYAHAESLASIFFIEQVLSLSTPASRTLIAALTVFCRKYARPACNTLLSPLLDKAETGSVYADFLFRMISECLESHELHLCFDPIFKVSCTEVSVGVLHLLINKKVQPFHIGFLSNALNSNQTFMKKSLQNALKKLQEHFK